MQFTELTPKAKCYAMDTYNQSEDYWYEHTIEQAKEDGLALGFYIDEIAFSGFHSQGDGASWTGHINLGEYIDANIKEDDPKHASYMVMRELIRNEWIDERLPIEWRSFMYLHSNTMSRGEARDYAFELIDEANPNVLNIGILAGANVYELYNSINGEYLLFELCERAFKHAKEYADDVYKKLEADYNHYASEEVFAETAEINEWDFDETGRIK